MNMRLLRKIRRRFMIHWDKTEHKYDIKDYKENRWITVYTTQDAIFVTAKHFMSSRKLEHRIYDDI